MKKSPIETHKDADAKVMRLKLMAIIKDDTASNKDATEAVKALARMHHLLQIDRTTVKATAKSGPNIEPDKQKEILDRVDDIINANLYGRETDASKEPS